MQGGARVAVDRHRGVAVWVAEVGEIDDVDALFKRIDALIVRTLISVEPSVTAACRRYCAQKNCAFELFGFDILIDDQLKVWLLEVNYTLPISLPSGEQPLLH